jgi:hypothetical protein
VLLVDGEGRVHATNRAADALLAAGDGLAVEPSHGSARGQLRAATPSATAALRRLVAAASAGATHVDVDVRVRPPTSLALLRPSGLAALALLAAPLARAPAARPSWAASMHARRATVALFVSDPAAASDGVGRASGCARPTGSRRRRRRSPSGSRTARGCRRSPRRTASRWRRCGRRRGRRTARRACAARPPWRGWWRGWRACADGNDRYCKEFPRRT